MASLSKWSTFRSRLSNWRSDSQDFVHQQVDFTSQFGPSPLLVEGMDCIGLNPFGGDTSEVSSSLKKGTL